MKNFKTCSFLWAWKRINGNNSKRKQSKEKQKGEFSFVYLRPFVKAFIRSLKAKFKLVLYSYKDSKTVQAITHKINEVFEEELFDAYISMPCSKKKQYMELEHFLTEEENRDHKNCLIMDSCPETINRNISNSIPVPPFDGFHKDSTLFLWEKYVQSVVESDANFSKFIETSFLS